VPGRRYRCAPDPKEAPCPPLVTDKDQWLASPTREEVLGPWASPNIRAFVDPQGPTRVAVLIDVADMADCGNPSSDGPPSRRAQTGGICLNDACADYVFWKKEKSRGSRLHNRRYGRIALEQ
jgi:hypothetical protein